jgi:hypothetical protein
MIVSIHSVTNLFRGYDMNIADQTAVQFDPLLERNYGPENISQCRRRQENTFDY